MLICMRGENNCNKKNGLLGRWFYLFLFFTDCVIVTVRGPISVSINFRGPPINIPVDILLMEIPNVRGREC